MTRMSRSYVAEQRWDPEREPSPGTKRPWEAVAWPWPQDPWGGCWSSLILGLDQEGPPSLSSEGIGKATCSHPHGRAPQASAGAPSPREAGAKTSRPAGLHIQPRTHRVSPGGSESHAGRTDGRGRGPSEQTLGVI